MNDIKNLSYQGHSLQYQVRIAGINFADTVTDISDIEQNLDYPNLTEYRVGECQVTLKNPDGQFSSNNPNNFFVQQGLSANGAGAEVQIRAGYQDVLETLLTGKILKVIEDPVQATVEIVVVDSLHAARGQDITDFGLEKRFHIDADPEPDVNGNYPLPDWVLPLSGESVTVYKAVDKTLTEVPELASRGFLNPDNFVATSDGIQTEGGPVQSPATGYPQVSAKVPYRYRNIRNVISDLLGLIDVSESVVEIPEIDIGNHFDSNGRVGYSIVGTAPFGTSNPVSWIGFTTDWLYEDGVYYLLYNPRRGDRVNRAVLLARNKESSVYSVVYRAPTVSGATTEFWKLAKNGNEIVILATDVTYDVDRKLADFDEIPPVPPGAYDPTQSGSSAYVFSYNISTGSRTSVVAKNATLKPVIGTRLLLGQTQPDFRFADVPILASNYRLAGVFPKRPPDVLPDTRRSFLWNGSRLYYVYATSTHVGVCRKQLTGPAASLLAVPLDGINHLGLDFDIVGSDLFVGCVFKEDTQSRAVGFKLSIS